MKTLYRNIIVAVAGLVANPLLAQTDAPKDSIGSQSVVVFSDQTPVVEDADKLNYPAEIPSYQREKTVPKYEVPNRQVDVTYEPVTIRPLGISKEKPLDFPSSYVSLALVHSSALSLKPCTMAVNW